MSERFCRPNFGTAYLKAMKGGNKKIPTKGTVFLSISNKLKVEFIDLGANAGNYRLTKRGAKGVKNIKVDGKSGQVVVALTPGAANQILATTSSGKVIRTHIDSIREIARVGRGVKVMSVDEKEKVVAVALHNEDDEEKNSDLNSSQDNDE